MRKKGFTLVEIMIVVAILGLIIAITLPGILRMRQDAQAGKTQAELSSLYKAFTMFYLTTEQYPQGLSEFGDYITIHDIENKYELNPNLPRW